LKYKVRMRGANGAQSGPVLRPRSAKRIIPMNAPDLTAPNRDRPPPLAHWRHFEHRADIGVEGVGCSPAEAFAQAALALTAIVCDPAEVQPLVALDIACAEPDLELLLVDWLNALIYRMATERMLFSRFDVHIDEARLSAVIHGEPVDRQRHQPAVEVKGATYTALAVTRDEHGLWTARCVVDV
jgi:SHS2 domain-containing protein